MENLRRLERFSLKLPAAIETVPDTEEHDKKVLNLLTANVCSGGAFFHTDKPLPEGTSVKTYVDDGVIRGGENSNCDTLAPTIKINLARQVMDDPPNLFRYEFLTHVAVVIHETGSRISRVGFHIAASISPRVSFSKRRLSCSVVNTLRSVPKWNKSTIVAPLFSSMPGRWIRSSACDRLSGMKSFE